MKENGKVQLLYVENSEIRDWFAEKIENFGYEVTPCKDSEEAKTAFENDINRYAVALVDLGLPQRNVDGVIVDDNDPKVGIDLLHYLRERRPDIDLVAYSLLQASKFTRPIITQLVAARVSFVPLKMHGKLDDLDLVLRAARRGYVVHAPQLAPKLAEIALPPDLLDGWEYKILEMRARDMTLEEICKEDNIALETLRSDFDSIYGKLEDNNLIDEPKDDERRNPQVLHYAYRALKLQKGSADQSCVRPKRRRQYRKRGS